MTQPDPRDLRPTEYGKVVKRETRQYPAIPAEPIPDHLADTNPLQAITPPPEGPNRLFGAVSLFGALLLTTATVLVVLLPGGSTDVTPTPPAIIDAPVTLPTDAAPEALPDPGPEIGLVPVEAPITMLPTLDPQAAAALLAAPVGAAQTDGIQLVRNVYDPFTIIPDRPRDGVVQYEIVAGDTIFTIAERFGLAPESIAWSNDRSIIGGLRPGRMINIPPVDGALYTVPAQETIQQVASRFGVDAFAIIDSEFNELFGASPETALPSGTVVIVPGGQAEQISWNPVVQRVEGTNNGGVSAISFSSGDPGSCGLVENPGGSGGWTNPMSGAGYQWTRGFTSFHTGVDLAAPPGTPVRAAQGGAVIFAGWNNFGYGYAIVLAHGPFTTVYGHLSAINVGCRQVVGAGQVIGAVGSTGDSSGPHLHFEIRYNDIAQDPTSILPF